MIYVYSVQTFYIEINQTILIVPFTRMVRTPSTGPTSIKFDSIQEKFRALSYWLLEVILFSINSNITIKINSVHLKLTLKDFY